MNLLPFRITADPPKDYAMLERAGVQAVSAGSNIRKAARKVRELIWQAERGGWSSSAVA